MFVVVSKPWRVAQLRKLRARNHCYFYTSLALFDLGGEWGAEQEEETRSLFVKQGFPQRRASIVCSLLTTCYFAIGGKNSSTTTTPASAFGRRKQFHQCWCAGVVLITIYSVHLDSARRGTCGDQFSLGGSAGGTRGPFRLECRRYFVTIRNRGLTRYHPPSGRRARRVNPSLPPNTGRMPSIRLLLKTYSRGGRISRRQQ